MSLVTCSLIASVASVPEDARARGRSEPGAASKRATAARTVLR